MVVDDEVDVEEEEEEVLDVAVGAEGAEDGSAGNLEIRKKNIYNATMTDQMARGV